MFQWVQAALVQYYPRLITTTTHTNNTHLTDMAMEVRGVCLQNKGKIATLHKKACNYLTKCL